MMENKKRALQKFLPVRAQVSAEVLLGIGIIFMIFIIILVVNNEQRTEVQETSDLIERKAECTKISNYLTYAFANENSKIEFETDYIIDIPSGGLLDINTVKSNVTTENDIAFLVSNCGTSEESTFNELNAIMDPDPDWYKQCLSGCTGGTSCPTWFNSRGITKTFNDLMGNISKYETVYLEDAHIDYRGKFLGVNYTKIIENWVGGGKALIISEHPICRYVSSSPQGYQCSYAEGSGDVWSFLNIKFYQRGGSYGNNVKVINPIEPINLSLNEVLDFEESSFIRDPQATLQREETEDGNMQLVNGFGDTTTCVCSSPSDGECIRHTGSATAYANATWTSDLNGVYDIKVRYCGENDGDDNWRVYKLAGGAAPGTQIDNWSTTSSQPNWQDRTISGISLATGDKVRLSCDRGTSNSNCRVDFIELVPNAEPQVTIIGNYTSGSSVRETGIATWNYGSGKVYYFGDFQANMVTFPNKAFSSVLTKFISEVFYYIYGGKANVLCTYVPKRKPSQVPADMTGKIRIKNVRGEVVIEKIQ